MPFDPERPLPGPPEPWAPSTMPIPRGAPPYAMTEMIAAEPALAERLVRRLASDPGVAALAAAVSDMAGGGRAIATTGCGTSEHAATAVAAILADALAAARLPSDRVAPSQAFELAGRPLTAGLVVGVSHEGGTAATNLALERARSGGARTALITVGDRSPGAALADHLLLTGEHDQSWCHTVGYLSPLVVATVVAGVVRGEPVDPVAVRALLDAADHAPAADEMAKALLPCSRVLVIGSGVDRASARELALKIEEGARLPAVAHELETVLHGHLASADATTGTVLILTDGEERGRELAERAVAVLRAAGALGMPVAAIVAADRRDDLFANLTSAGRAAVPITKELPRVVGAALGSAIPLQLLAERLARARGVNPDTLGREDPRQAAAGEF